jgi:hypothetical protein
MLTILLSSPENTPVEGAIYRPSMLAWGGFMAERQAENDTIGKRGLDDEVGNAAGPIPPGPPIATLDDQVGNAAGPIPPGPAIAHSTRPAYRSFHPARLSLLSTTR